MKVYQIISEASFIPATPAELAMMDPNQLRKYRRAEAAARTTAQLTAQQQAKSAADSSARRAKASKMRYQKDKPIASKVSDIKQAAADKLKTTGSVGKSIAKTFEPGTKPQDAYKKIRDEAAKNPKVKDLAEKLFKSKFAWGVRVVLDAVQIATSLIVLAEDRAQIDEYEKSGAMDANTAQNCRDYALRKFGFEAAAAIASSVGSIAFARAILFVIRFVLGAAGIASGIGTAATIAAAIASEIAIQAFVAYIKTPAGATMFGNYFAGVLIDDDSIAQQALSSMLKVIGISSNTSTMRPPTGTPQPSTSPIEQGSLSPDVEAAIRSLEK